MRVQEWVDGAMGGPDTKAAKIDASITRTE